ncbi:MAG TPA: nucleotidyltransferase domain-containing protein [Oligoflexia bacterium]|nr:nucleotidyltransferase domain-containing protein [Oligoflexia bacterium]HMP48127.1 nucleotidyltransferase domain-containing protein [Oligoflexia bacterium]
MNFCLSKEKLLYFASKLGLGSFGGLCEAAKVHRNSLTPYLKGERSPYTQVVLDLASALKVSPDELIVEVSEDLGSQLYKRISPLIAGRTLAFFMFGSRARKTEKKYSDIDIGVSGGSARIDFESFVLLKSQIEDVFDDFPYTLNIVNLDMAPDEFLFSIEKDLTFLFGDKESSHYLLGYIHGRKKN